MEIWKDVVGYEGLYQVSNYGRVKSLERKINNRIYEERIISQEKSKDGYLRVDLHKDGNRKHKKVHRLVAQAFIPNPENKPFVLHKVGVNVGGTDHVSNLYWGDHMENMKDRKKEGYHSKQAEEKLGRPVLQIDLKTKEVIMEHPSTESAARHLNKTSQNISAVCRGERLSAYGYFWKYKYPKTN